MSKEFEEHRRWFSDFKTNENRGDALTLDIEEIRSKIKLSHTASFDIARVILEKIRSKRLINYL